MKAIVRDRYGPPEVLELRDLEQPQPTDDSVLVRVHAASLNPVDWYELAGRPWIARAQHGLRRPKNIRVGTDFAGRIESTGDEVFGIKKGALAEYVAAAPTRLAPKPPQLSFEQAAAIPVSGVTALQALRDHAGVQPGQHVLINGASGGVGTFTVQHAKRLGAEVTAVCSTGKVELVRSLGADRVVDYTQEDFTRGAARYDAMIDIAGSRRLAELRRVLAPRATIVIVGGPKTNRLLGPLSHVARMRTASVGRAQKVVFFLADVNPADLLEAAEVTPVIDRTYTLAEVPEAFHYLAGGHAPGKIVVIV